MKDKTYKWRNGFRSRVNANVVGQALEDIRRANGGKLTPNAVVEASRDPEAPLHNAFEWDVDAAAQAHWLTTARSLIRYIEVVYVDANGKQVPHRGYLNMPDPDDDGTRVYEPVYEIVSERDRHAIAIEEAKASLEAWHRRYGEIVEMPRRLKDEIAAFTGKKSAKPKRRPKAARRPELVANP